MNEQQILRLATFGENCDLAADF